MISVLGRENEQRNANTRWRAEDLRDAVLAVYSGKIDASSVHRKHNGVSKRHVTRLVHQIPKNTKDTDQRLTLTRTVNDLVKLSKNAVYTTWELREAIVSVLTKAMKPGRAAAEFGPHPRTLRTWCQKARKLVPEGADEKAIREIVYGLDIKSVGR